VDLSKYMEVDDFVQRSGFARSSVYRWIDEGLLESTVILYRRLIPVSEFERIQTYGSPKKSRKK